MSSNGKKCVFGVLPAQLFVASANLKRIFRQSKSPTRWLHLVSYVKLRLKNVSLTVQFPRFETVSVIVVGVSEIDLVRVCE